MARGKSKTTARKTANRRSVSSKRKQSSAASQVSRKVKIFFSSFIGRFVLVISLVMFVVAAQAWYFNQDIEPFFFCWDWKSLLLLF